MTCLVPAVALIFQLMCFFKVILSGKNALPSLYIYIIYTERQNDRCINGSQQDVHYLGNALWISSNMKKRRDKKEWKVYFSKIL